MKKVMNKSAIAIAIMATITLAASQKTEARSKIEDSLKSRTETPVEFKYMGKMNAQPLFQLNLKNAEANEYLITLTDQNGTVLYDEKIAGKDLSRKYMLNLDEIDASEIRFHIKNQKDKSTTNFTVKRNFSFVDEWAMK